MDPRTEELISLVKRVIWTILLLLVGVALLSSMPQRDSSVAYAGRVFVLVFAPASTGMSIYLGVGLVKRSLQYTARKLHIW